MTWDRSNYINCLKWWLTLITFLVLSLKIDAQNNFAFKKVTFDKIGFEEGFTQNSVYDIFQDSYGFLWFATPNGLFQYDGYSFRVISNDQAEAIRISHNMVNQIAEDQKKRLWILNPQAINVYDRFENISKIFSLDSLRGVNVISIVPDLQFASKIWFATQENIGFLTIDDQSLLIDKITYPLLERNSLSTVLIRKIHQDHKGSIWIQKGNTLSFIEEHEDQFSEIEFSKDFVVHDIIDNKEGLLFASHENGITLITRKKDGSFEYNTERTKVNLPELISQKNVSGLYEATNGNVGFVIWGHGIGEFNDQGEVQFYWPVFEDSEQFRDGIFWTTLMEKSEVLWIGTMSGGLFKGDLNQKPFYSVTERNSIHPGLTDKFVNEITGDDNGNIWIGTLYGGVTHLTIENNRVEIQDDFNEQVGISKEKASMGILFDDEGTLWVDNPNGGVKRIRFDENMKPSRVIKYNERTSSSLPMNTVHTIQQDRFGVIWMSSNYGEGLVRVDMEDNGDPVFIKFEDEEFEDATIKAVYRDKEGYLWISTRTIGVYRVRLDNQNQPIEKINISDREKADILSMNYALSFLEDEFGNVWIATFGGGLVKTRLPKKFKGEYQFEYYRKRDGLSNDAVYSLLMDNTNRIWMSTDEGLCNFDPTSKTFTRYNMLDGLQNNNFRDWSVWQNNEGIMYFGGADGLTFFNPAEILKTNRQGQVRITKFIVAGKEQTIEKYTSYDGQKLDPLILDPENRAVSFEFSAMLFDNPLKCRYRYMLEGFDQNWIEVGANRRLATYPLLDDGTYTFKVMSSNGDGYWNTNHLTATFKILPYWYDTIWAHMFYVTFAFSAVYLWFYILKKRQEFRNELRFEQLEKENIQELNKAKFAFFTNISHELKTPLTIISNVIENAITNNKASDYLGNEFTIIRKSTDRMLRLVRQLLDFRKAETGHMPLNLQHSDIVDFFKELSVFFKEYAESQNIDFIFKTAEKEIFTDFDPDKIEKVLSNLVDNSMKYTNDGSAIRIELATVDLNDLPTYLIHSLKGHPRYVQIKVIDNGQGLPSGYEELVFDKFYRVKGSDRYVQKRDGAGIGLAFSKTLVKLHEGQIYAEPSNGFGATFTVILPILNNISKPVDSPDTITEVIEKSRKRYMIHLDNGHRKLIPQGEMVVFHNKEILVVEDNAEIRSFLEEFLSKKFKVYGAENGKKGAKMARERIPDLIVTDVMMPEMDGIALAKELKSDELTNHIPIIMLTANADEEHRIEGLKAGADSYIPKPFKMEHLEVRIQKLLELRQQLKKKYINLGGSGNEDLQAADAREEDKKFIADIKNLIELHLTDSEFTVAKIEESLGYSRMQLYRKIKSLSGLNSVEFVRHYRMRKAIDMMHSTNLRVTEIIYAVGFTSPSYFGKCFKETYGRTPKEFAKEVRSV